MKRFKDMNSVEKVEYLNEKFIVRDGKIYHRKLDHPRKKPGPVGNVSGGYLQVSVGASTQKVHRVIFALHHCYWPENSIDHINGDRLDNRIENLQEASLSCSNTKAKWKVGKSGIRGINQIGTSWRAKISDGQGKGIRSKLRPTRGQALLDWCDMMTIKMSTEACLSLQLRHNFDLADRYKRMFGDRRDGAWNDKMELRLASKQSKIKGVSWNEPNQKWRARVTINGNRKYLGIFTEESDAADAVRQAGKTY